MSIKGLVFDFGGVIMCTIDRNPRSMLAKKYNVTVEAIERLVFSSASAKMAEVGSISAYQHWQHVAQALRASEEEIPTMRQQFFAGDRMNRDLLESIQSLHKKYCIALLSNAFDDLRAELTGESPAPSAYPISTSDHFLDFFDEIIISAEIGFAKPDRRIYQWAAARLRVPIEKCVFIDDFPSNVEGARQAGMQAIHFENTTQIREDLEVLLNSNHTTRSRD